MNSYFKLIEISKELHPNWGMYIHICHVIDESKIPRRDIFKIFNKFMPEEEYDKSEKIDLINYLELVSLGLKGK